MASARWRARWPSLSRRISAEVPLYRRLDHELGFAPDQAPAEPIEDASGRLVRLIELRRRRVVACVAGHAKASSEKRKGDPSSPIRRKDPEHSDPGTGWVHPDPNQADVLAVARVDSHEVRPRVERGVPEAVRELLGCALPTGCAGDVVAERVVEEAEALHVGIGGGGGSHTCR